MEQSTFWSEEHLVKISQSPDSEKDWMASVVNSQSNSLTLLAGCGPDGWYGRTFPAYCQWMEDERLESFLGLLGKLGYGIAYRVLDAQYAGVPQRRRRVFVVGYLRDWRRAAAVLFERHSLSGHPPPSREKGQSTTHDLAPSLTNSGRGVQRAGDKRGQDPVVAVARSVAIRGRDGVPQVELGDEIANAILTPNGGRGGIGVGAVLAETPAAGCWWDGGQVSQTLDAVLSKGQMMPEKNRFPAVLVPATAHSLRADGFDASEDGTGRGTPLIPVVYRVHGENSTAMVGPGIANVADPVDIVRSLDSCGGYASNQGGNVVLQPVAVHTTGSGFWKEGLGTLRGREQDSHENLVMALQAGSIRENPESGPDGVGVRTDGIAYTLEARAEVQAIAFSSKDHGGDAGELAPTLRSMSHDGSHANGGGQIAVAIGIDEEQNAVQDGFGCLKARKEGGGFEGSVMTPSMAVRRLTPMECERLQGFPDGYTKVPTGKGKFMADGPRYKMLGNSMAVPVMHWIGKRIQLVEDTFGG